MKTSRKSSTSRRRPPPLFAERRNRKPQGGKPRARPSLFRRLWRWTGYLLIVLVVLTLLPGILLRWVDPPTSAFMQRLVEDPTVRHYEWRDWDRISPELKIAVVAAEDQLFPTHFGFDFKSITQALEDRRRGGSSRGASSITQQVAKNLFLWSGQSWLRKGIEAWLAIGLELTLSKQRILEIYLNIAQWGERQFGAQAASEYYFAKDASHLNRHEAALLAAVLPNPVIYRADRPSAYTRERQRWILNQIRGLGGPAYLQEL